MSDANRYPARHTLQSNKFRTESSSVTLPWAPFAKRKIDTQKTPSPLALCLVAWGGYTGAEVGGVQSGGRVIMTEWGNPIEKGRPGTGWGRAGRAIRGGVSEWCSRAARGSGYKGTGLFSGLPPPTTLAAMLEPLPTQWPVCVGGGGGGAINWIAPAQPGCSVGSPPSCCLTPCW